MIALGPGRAAAMGHLVAGRVSRRGSRHRCSCWERCSTIFLGLALLVRPAGASYVLYAHDRGDRRFYLLVGTVPLPRSSGSIRWGPSPQDRADADRGCCSRSPFSTSGERRGERAR